LGPKDIDIDDAFQIMAKEADPTTLTVVLHVLIPTFGGPTPESQSV
jgi:hypothetical protein